MAGDDPEMTGDGFSAPRRSRDQRDRQRGEHHHGGRGRPAQRGPGVAQGHGGGRRRRPYPDHGQRGASAKASAVTAAAPATRPSRRRWESRWRSTPGTEGTEVGNFELNGKSTPFDITVPTMPIKVILDPVRKILRDSPELQTSVQLSLGDDLKQRTDLLGAIRAYEKALQTNPRKSLAHYRIGEVLYEQFNLQSAANAFREALNGDKDPKWIETWSYIFLGKIYDILSQRQRAMAEYTKAVNTKDDTFGAQTEAKTWLDKPFTRERTTMDKDAKQPD